ncbi:SGNH/GDSL hydrolase family protein [Pedobacter boryungensis]|uniref:SGNH/GDSL hydrolase family protein n=1 Tax=Pedobacter boryungensis TaxID=869962 RepID=A0ABX2DDH6_9SPHI|nr:GDSL-type esterase/lipase family protein [Pedobacter boryungensis]NQX31867.1 SGNH/GDSL hydrolase family protein [Pedobacter boryungensis]
MKFSFGFLSLCLLLACNKTAETAMIQNPTPTNNSSLNYLALGDSYTIGEAVSQKESFPYQVTAQLNEQGLKFGAPKIIAKTGWTTDELQAAIKAEKITGTYDVVTLLIGVNNQYRGNSQTTYRKEFAALLQTAISFAGGNKKHVFVVSIPDWGVTPFGKGSGRNTTTIAQEIDAFNAICKEETLGMSVKYIDITPGSRNAATDASLVATDGLHPSRKMYSEWAVKISNAIASNFK